MQDYRVQLDVYHGPLDLLLYLIKREEVDITEIDVAPIAEQYMSYLRTIERLDINLAGEFLVMAATLMEIKSAMIAPPPERDEDDESEPADPLSPSEDPTDPRYELIQQLLAYKRYKDAAGELDERREAFHARFARAPHKVAAEPQQVELDMEDVSLWDLVEAFGRMIEQVGIRDHRHEVIVDDTPIELHQADLVARLEREGPLSLQAVFEGRKHGEMIGLFLATLELVRQRRLSVRQAEAGGEIHLALRDAAEAEAEIEAESDAPAREPTDITDADAFEWTDAQQKQRYLRRQARRAKGEKVEEDEEMETEIAALEAEERARGAYDDDDDARDADADGEAKSAE